MGSEQAPQGLPPAGWYRDPENPDGPPRWWDGVRWTDRYASTEVARAHPGPVVRRPRAAGVPAVLRGVHQANQGENSAYALGTVFGGDDRSRSCWRCCPLDLRPLQRARAARLVAVGVRDRSGDRHASPCSAAVAADADDDERAAPARRQFAAAGSECDSAGDEAFPPLGWRAGLPRADPGRAQPDGHARDCRPRSRTHSSYGWSRRGETPVAVLTVAAVGTDPAAGRRRAGGVQRPPGAVGQRAEDVRR